MKVTYFDTGPIPIRFGVCFSEKSFLKEMKKLNMKQPDPWIMEKAHATTHTLFNSRYGRIIIVCLAPPKRWHTRDVTWGLLTHEAVHVYQRAVQGMHEEGLCMEFMAYCIQDWSQKLWLEWERQRKLV